ncbi:MAG: HpaII family restriction endonuclease, partial [Prevotella sp.]|nr:HpaII family restriction endonuclease [Prevotella sp.]
MLTGNKGEWSEIYTLLKLLGEGEVYAGDEQLNKITELIYPVVMILREETARRIEFKRERTTIEIQTSAGDKRLTIDAVVFLDMAEKLLRRINSVSGVFAVPAIEEFMHSIYCNSLKA